MSSLHLALYRKYRSATFDEVYGQNHITSVLKYQAKSGRVSHAYLFCGSRGTGKTSCAKILAKAVNCEHPIDGNPCCKCEACLSIDKGTATDVVEMDAASETGVDYIRSIKEEVQYPPALLKKRVYIIDEIHMLSESAFNALLKTLEEPPEHVIFILATTELHKMPSTVISRCQRFDFRRLSVQTLCSRLRYIADKEDIKLEDSAVQIIAKQAQGGMRDAISLFELCSGGGADVTEERVYDILGISGYENVCAAALAIADKDMSALFDVVASVSSSSKDITVFWQELTSFYRDMLIAKYADDPKGYLDITDNEFALLEKAASKFTLSSLFYQSKILDTALKDMNRMPQTKRMTAEFALVKMCDESLDTSVEALLSRIEALENGVLLSGAVGVQNSVSDAPAAKSTDAGTEKKAEPASKKRSFFEPLPEEETSAVEADKTGGLVKVPDLSDVVEKLLKTDMMCGMILAEATAEMSPDGSVIRITTDNSFAKTYFTDDLRRAVSDAFMTAKINDRPATVEIIVSDAKNGRASDELFKN